MKICLLSVASFGIAFGLERPNTPPEPRNDALQSVVEAPTQQLKKIPILNTDKTSEQPKNLNHNIAPSPAWLGVRGECINDTLKSHLGLDHGIILRVIAPNSPAEKAGLKEHDIILNINGKSLTCQNCLKGAIREVDSDFQVSLDIISEGQALTKVITLSERPEALKNTPPPSQNEQHISEQNSSEHQEKRPTVKRGITSFLKDMGLDRLLKEVTPSNSFNFDFQATSSVSILDDEGSVEINVLNKNKSIKIKDHHGNIQYEGPWNSEEDKASAPPAVQERVKDIDFNFNSQRFGLSPKPQLEMR